jgi:hypothetical protein
MSDEELAVQGWKRNDKGGLTRVAFTNEQRRARGRTWGLVGLVKGLWGGAAPATIADARLMVCRNCSEKGSDGERLFRVGKIDGEVYCGLPRLNELTKIHRDEAKDGCGCELTFKTSRAESACPLGKWAAISAAVNASAEAKAEPSAEQPKRRCCGGS